MEETDEEKCFRHLKRKTFDEADKARVDYYKTLSPYRDRNDEIGLTDEEVEIDISFLNVYLLRVANWTYEEYEKEDASQLSEVRRHNNLHNQIIGLTPQQLILKLKLKLPPPPPPPHPTTRTT